MRSLKYLFIEEIYFHQRLYFICVILKQLEKTDFTQLNLPKVTISQNALVSLRKLIQETLTISCELMRNKKKSLSKILLSEVCFWEN